MRTQTCASPLQYVQGRLLTSEGSLLRAKEHSLDSKAPVARRALALRRLHYGQRGRVVSGRPGQEELQCQRGVQIRHGRWQRRPEFRQRCLHRRQVRHAQVPTPSGEALRSCQRIFERWIAVLCRL